MTTGRETIGQPAPGGGRARRQAHSTRAGRAWRETTTRRGTSLRASQTFVRDSLERLAGAPLPGVEEVVARAHARWLDPGQVLVEEGAPAPWLILVESGVLAETLTWGSRSVTLEFLGRGQVGGNVFALRSAAMSPFGQGDGAKRSERAVSPYRYRAPVLTRVNLLEAEQLGRFAARDRAWAELRDQIGVSQGLALQRRELERAFLSPAERYERLQAARGDVAQQLTQREIAQYLGVSEVTMSRIKARGGGPPS